MEALTEAIYAVDTKRYARCVENSKRMRFDIDRDVMRGRNFDFNPKFLPDGLSRVDLREESQHVILDELEWRRETDRLSAAERDRGVDELIELVAAVDTIVQSHATQQGRIAKALAPILC